MPPLSFSSQSGGAAAALQKRDPLAKGHRLSVHWSLRH
jgi:hypothetical protein